MNVEEIAESAIESIDAFVAGLVAGTALAMYPDATQVNADNVGNLWEAFAKLDRDLGFPPGFLRSRHRHMMSTALTYRRAILALNKRTNVQPNT